MPPGPAGSGIILRVNFICTGLQGCRWVWTLQVGSGCELILQCCLACTHLNLAKTFSSMPRPRWRGRGHGYVHADANVSGGRQPKSTTGAELMNTTFTANTSPCTYGAYPCRYRAGRSMLRSSGPFKTRSILAETTEVKVGIITPRATNRGWFGSGRG